jgi:hypothetical protein
MGNENGKREARTIDNRGSGLHGCLPFPISHFPFPVSRFPIPVSVKCQAVERLVMPLLSYIAEARTWCAQMTEELRK